MGRFGRFRAARRALIVPRVPQAPLVICRACGVVAPERRDGCEACGRPLRETRVAAPAMPLEQHWAAVRCGLVCNSCRFLAPLDALDFDGAVECAHCGLRQRFDVETWQGALELARSVSDLAGPSPEGRSPHLEIWVGDDNPHREVGLSQTFVKAELGMLVVSAAPGHPVCRRCTEPLHAQVTRRGVVDTRCPRCNETGSYALPADALRSDQLLGAVADPHRTDCPKALFTQQGGLATLSCPQCNAPLTPVPGSALQRCRFCNTSSIVTESHLHRALQRTVEPSTFWVLFPRGSAAREQLQTAAGTGIQEQSVGVLKSTRKPVGAEHTVYEAPEVEGPQALQILVGSIVGSVALVVGLVLARVFGLFG